MATFDDHLRTVDLSDRRSLTHYNFLLHLLVVTLCEHFMQEVVDFVVLLGAQPRVLALEKVSADSGGGLVSSSNKDATVYTVFSMRIHLLLEGKRNSIPELVSTKQGRSQRSSCCRAHKQEATLGI
jgi:hypothetical protein